MSAHSAIDLGNFFRFEHEDYPRESRSWFIQGYKTGGGLLSEGWEKAARLLDLTSMVDFLSRTPDYPKTLQTARFIIEKTLADIVEWKSG